MDLAQPSKALAESAGLSSSSGPWAFQAASPLDLLRQDENACRVGENGHGRMIEPVRIRGEEVPGPGDLLRQG